VSVKEKRVKASDTFHSNIADKEREVGGFPYIALPVGGHRRVVKRQKGIRANRLKSVLIHVVGGKTHCIFPKRWAGT